MNYQDSWTDHARRLLELHEEALDFVRRAAEGGLPAQPHDARAVGRLWLETEKLDAMMCGLLDQINIDLLDSNGAMDATRGAAMRDSIMDESYLAYECSWTLEWQDRGLSLILSVDPRTNSFDAQVQGKISREPTTIRIPVVESQLTEALIESFVAEQVWQNEPDATL